MKLWTAITVLVSFVMLVLMLATFGVLLDTNSSLWNKPYAMRTPADDWSVAWPVVVLIFLGIGQFFAWGVWRAKRAAWKDEQQQLMWQKERERQVEREREAKWQAILAADPDALPVAAPESSSTPM
jgi:hypothetical protein